MKHYLLYFRNTGKSYKINVGTLDPGLVCYDTHIHLSYNLILGNLFVPYRPDY